MHVTDCRCDIAIQGVHQIGPSQLFLFLNFILLNGLEKLFDFITGPHGY